MTGVDYLPATILGAIFPPAFIFFSVSPNNKALLNLLCMDAVLGAIHLPNVPICDNSAKVALSPALSVSSALTPAFRYTEQLLSRRPLWRCAHFFTAPTTFPAQLLFSTAHGLPLHNATPLPSGHFFSVSPYDETSLRLHCLDAVLDAIQLPNVSKCANLLSPALSFPSRRLHQHLNARNNSYLAPCSGVAS